MSRAIDGDAVKRRAWDIAEAWRDQGRGYEALLLESVVEQIVDTAPTLTPQNEPLTIEQLREMDGEPLGEVEKIIHAHWENTGGNEKAGLAYGTCSHCHREAWANYELTPRCPYCGAHMDEAKS